MNQQSYLCCVFFTSCSVCKSVWPRVTLPFRTLIYVYPLKIQFHCCYCCEGWVLNMTELCVTWVQVRCKVKIKKILQ